MAQDPQITILNATGSRDERVSDRLGDVDRVTRAMRRDATTEWRSIPYVNGWDDHVDLYGGVYLRGGYRRTMLRTIELRGLIAKSPATWAPPEVIFTLPPGFRPGAEVILLCGAAGTGSIEICRLNISAAGVVTQISGQTGGVGYVSLTGLSFPL